MEQEQKTSPSKGRETLVNILLTLILGGSFLFFLNVVTFGIMFDVAAAILGIAMIGYIHYLLWGHALSQQVAGEREEQRIKDQLDAMRDYDDPYPRRYGEQRHD